MGLEILFSTYVLIIFFAVNIFFVLLQRNLFPQAFEVMTAKRILLGYVFVIGLNLAVALFLGKGVLKDSIGTFVLSCYGSIFLVTFVLLPISLLLVRSSRYTFVKGISVGIFLGVIFLLLVLYFGGAERMSSIGVTRWLSIHAGIFSFVVAVSTAFAAALRRR